MQIQYKAVAIEFLCAGTLDELKTKIDDALAKNQMFHGDWRQLEDGTYAQAMCPAEWRPVPQPPGVESGLLLPQAQSPARILG